MLKGKAMIHDTNNRDAYDHDRIRGNETDELNHLVQQLGVSRDSIEWAIEAVGNDRQKIEDYIKRSGLL